MPGILPLQSGFANSMRVALRYSRLTEELARRITNDATYSMTEHDPTRADPYITRDENGKVTRVWRTGDDVARINRLNRYTRVLAEGIKAVQPGYYDRKADDPSQQAIWHAFNLVNVVSTATADAAVGGGVKVTTGMPGIDELLNDTMQLEDEIWQWIMEVSALSYIGVQVLVDHESSMMRLSRILPQNLYVQFDDTGNDWTRVSKKIYVDKYQIRDWEKVRDFAPTDFDGFVHEERHFRGWYENYLYAVNDDTIVCDVPLNYLDPSMMPVVFTGLQDFAITIIPNVVRVGRFRSDWDDALDINLLFNERASREGELLNEFAGPKLMVSNRQVSYDPTTGKTFYNVPRDGVLMVRPEDNFEPSYLQPSADIQGSKDNRDFLLGMLSVQTGTASILLNAEAADEIDSGIAYKMKMTPTILKVRRRMTAWKRAIKQVVFNMLSAIDYHGNMTLAESAITEAYEAGDDAMVEKAQKIKEYIKEHSSGISLDSFDELFKGVDVLSGAPMGVFIEDPRTASSPEELRYLATVPQLQHLEDRRVAMNALMHINSIDVQMQPAMPQDEASAQERLAGQQSMSVRRYLREYDSMSDEQIEEELDEIKGEQEAGMGLAPMGGFGEVMPPPEELPEDDQPVQQTGNQLAGMQSVSIEG